MKGLRLLAVMLSMLGAALPAPTFAAGRTPQPVVSIENPGQCIQPAAEMRKYHMEMLKHQRDRTMRQGIRGEAASLNGCIDCHASRKTGSVLGKDGFCESCHTYAAVKLDCFECHQPKARVKAAAASGGLK